MLEENNNLMEELDRDIEEARELTEDARSRMVQCEAKYTLKKAQVIFRVKNGTRLGDTAAKAQADIESIDDFNLYLVAEAQYRGAKMGLDNLINKKETLKERNYNERCAMKVFD